MHRKLSFSFCLILLAIFSGRGDAQENQSISQNNIAAKFVGDWSYEETKYGRLLSLSLTLKQTDKGFAGEYQNVASKESSGKILRATIKGNSAILEVDCDWGGRGTIKITPLKGNRLHWQVIKRDTSKGEFIVLLDQILKKQS